MLWTKQNSGVIINQCLCGPLLLPAGDVKSGDPIKVSAFNKPDRTPMPISRRPLVNFSDLAIWSLVSIGGGLVGLVVCLNGLTMVHYHILGSLMRLHWSVSTRIAHKHCSWQLEIYLAARSQKEINQPVLDIIALVWSRLRLIRIDILLA